MEAAALGTRFEPPYDDSRFVGNAEVIPFLPFVPDPTTIAFYGRYIYRLPIHRHVTDGVA
jgi:hypothetical protein